MCIPCVSWRSGGLYIPGLTPPGAAVELKYGKSDFEKRHFALFGLMCMYGIELLPDNIEECLDNPLANRHRA